MKNLIQRKVNRFIFLLMLSNFYYNIYGQTITKIDSVKFDGFIQLPLYDISPDNQKVAVVSVQKNNEKIIIYTQQSDSSKLLVSSVLDQKGAPPKSLCFSKDNNLLFFSTNQKGISVSKIDNNGKIYFYKNFVSADVSGGEIIFSNIKDMQVTGDGKYLVVAKSDPSAVILFEILSDGSLELKDYIDSSMPTKIFLNENIIYYNGVIGLNYPEGCCKTEILTNGKLSTPIKVCEYSINQFTSDFKYAILAEYDDLKLFKADNNGIYREEKKVSFNSEIGFDDSILDMAIDKTNENLIISSNSKDNIYSFEINKLTNSLKFRKVLLDLDYLNAGIKFTNDGKNMLVFHSGSGNFINKYKYRLFR